MVPELPPHLHPPPRWGEENLNPFQKVTVLGQSPPSHSSPAPRGYPWGGELKLLPPWWGKVGMGGKRDVIDRCSSRRCVRCAGGSLRKCCTRAIRGLVVRLGMVTEAFVLTSCEKKAGLNRSGGSADAPKHEKELHRSGEQIARRSRASYAFTTLSEGTPFEGVPRLYDQKGVRRVKGKERLIWTPPPSVGEDEGKGDVLRKIEGVDTLRPTQSLRLRGGSLMRGSGGGLVVGRDRTGRRGNGHQRRRPR